MLNIKKLYRLIMNFFIPRDYTFSGILIKSVYNANLYQKSIKNFKISGLNYRNKMNNIKIELTGDNRYKFNSFKKKYNFDNYHTFTENIAETVLGEIIKEITALRKNPVLCYFIKDSYTIDRNDVSCIKDAIYEIHNNHIHAPEEIDVLLHTQGGEINAAFEIIELLNKSFKKVNFLVPSYALSAGSMIVVSGDEIILAKHAQLSPFDLQLIDIPINIYMQEAKTLKEKTMAKKTLNDFKYVVKKIKKNLLRKHYHSSKNIPQKISLRYETHKLLNIFTNTKKFISHNESYYLKDLENTMLNIKEANKDLNDLLYEIDVILYFLFSQYEIFKITKTLYGQNTYLKSNYKE